MLRRTKLIIAAYCIGGLILLVLGIGMVLQFTHWFRHPEEFADHHHHGEEPEKPEAHPATTSTRDGRTFVSSPFLDRDFDVTDRSVDLRQILTASVNPDNFPILEKLQFVSPDQSPLGDQDAVLGARINGEEKAYPLRMLNPHVALNDLCGGKEIAVVYDPLTITPKVFERSVRQADGSAVVLTFANLGLIYNGGLLLYDKETESLWWPPEGRCLAGKLNGARLDELPFLFVSWKVWKERHPGTTILSLDTEFAAHYRQNPAEQYYMFEELPLPVEGWQGKTSRFPWNAPAIALEKDGKAKAYPLLVLDKIQGDIHDTFDGMKVVIHKDAPSYPTDESGGEVHYSFGLWFLWALRYPGIEVYEPESPKAPATSGDNSSVSVTKGRRNLARKWCDRPSKSISLLSKPQRSVRA